MGIETALFGSVVGALGPTLPTAGLLGVGGKFALGTAMSTLSTGFSIFSGLSSIASGAQQRSEAGYQAELAAQQAEMQAREQTRVSFREAQLETERADAARRKQKVAYLASGVDLTGSPLLVMEETRRTGQENVDEILMSGAAGAEAARAEGRIQAQNLKSRGRQAFTEGLSTGVTRIGSALVA